MPSLKNLQFERRVSIDDGERDTETRTVRAALSSETPVTRFFGDEVLRHSDKSIDLSRAGDNGLPLLVNHDDRSLPIGRVRNIALEGKTLRGDLTFSDATTQAREAWDLATEGTLSDVSIRYSIDAYKVRNEGKKDETYEVTRWTPLEASVVAIPADPSVGINRSMEGIQMPKQDDGPAVPDKTVDVSASRRAGIEEGARIERERIADIGAIAANFAGNPAVEDLRLAAVESNQSPEAFMRSLLGVVSGGPAEPLGHRAAPTTEAGPRIQAGPDSSDKFLRGVSEALHFRAGNLRDEKALESARASEFSGLSLVEIGRMGLERAGVSTRGMSPLDVAGAMLTRAIDPGTANLTTANFPAILENVMNKSLFMGFEEAPVTWNIWCGTGSSADFKPGTRPGVSQFTSLEVVAENGAVQDGIVTDKKEAFQVETYARKFSVTRQTIVNDDLGGLADVATKMGRAAARTVDEQVYAFVEANGAMTEDGFNLFDEVNHNNAPAAAGDPSVDNVGTARTRMGKQTDWNGVVLGIVPQYMVCPIELEQKMLEISTLNADPTRVRRDNVYRQLWEPVATPRLTDANDWYMFGAQGEHIDVIFLNGQQAPMMARDEGWSVLAAHWRVVLDFDVMAVDWRSAIQFTNV